MPRLWNKGGKGDKRARRDRHSAARHDAAADDTTSASDDVADRIDSVTSRYEKPPTADELRAAFGRKRQQDPVDPEPSSEPSFAEQFSTDSLYQATIEDAPAPKETAEDRSKTKGDYFYDPTDAWATLGLDKGATWDQISHAHRRLAMQHHPDRLLDVSPEDREASERTMREVNVAYSVLRRLTGN